MRRALARALLDGRVMATSMTGTVLEEVLLALRSLLDADELEAVRKIESEGCDVFVSIGPPRPGCRQCERTAREIRTALEALPGVDHAYVSVGPDVEPAWAGAGARG